MHSYVYIRNTNRKPVGCISFSVNEVGNTAEVSFALSVCAKEDQKKFTKKLARSIADERASLNKRFVLTNVDKTTRGGYVREIITFLSKADSPHPNVGLVPTSVKAFCRKWLKHKENFVSKGNIKELVEMEISTTLVPEAVKTTEVNLAS